jgi:hypothetical protein
MKLLQVRLDQRHWHRRLKVGIIALSLAILMLGISPIRVAQADSDRTTKGATSSDLSDIPNLEQMDSDKFEQYFGDVPNDHKPLFNPDNGKSNLIEDKNPFNDEAITPSDLKEGETNTRSKDA